MTVPSGTGALEATQQSVLSQLQSGINVTLSSGAASDTIATGNITAAQPTVGTPVAGGTVTLTLGAGQGTWEAQLTGTFSSGTTIAFEGTDSAGVTTNWFTSVGYDTTVTNPPNITSVSGPGPFVVRGSASGYQQVRMRASTLTMSDNIAVRLIGSNAPLGLGGLSTNDGSFAKETGGNLASILTQLQNGPTNVVAYGYNSGGPGGGTVDRLRVLQGKATNSLTISSAATSQAVVTLSSNAPATLLAGMQVLLTGGTQESAYVQSIAGAAVTLTSNIINSSHTALVYELFATNGPTTNAMTPIGVPVTANIGYDSSTQQYYMNRVSSAGATKVDGSAVTQPVSGTVNLTTGSSTIGYVGLNAGGNIIGNVELIDSGGVNKASISSGGAVKVDGSAVTQPISGTITANVGTTNGLALDTSVNGVIVAQGSTTSGEKGPLVQGAVTTGSPTYTTAQTSPISLTTAGAIRVDASTTTQPVSGTVTANVGTTNGLALDTSVNGVLVSQGSTTSGEKGPLVQGAVTTSAPSYTTAQTSPISLTTAGAVRVDASATTQPVSGTVSITANSAVNVAQISGTTTDTNSGNKSAGTQRIVLATDQPQLTNALKVDGSAVTQPVSQATASNLNAQVVGATASGASNAGNPVKAGGVFNTTQPTVTNGQTVDAQYTSRGAAIVATGVDAFAVNASQSGTWNVNNVSGTVSLPTGAATAAKQPALGTAGSASSDVITVQGIASMTALITEPYISRWIRNGQGFVATTGSKTASSTVAEALSIFNTHSSGKNILLYRIHAQYGVTASSHPVLTVTYQTSDPGPGWTSGATVTPVNASLGGAASVASVYQTAVASGATIAGTTVMISDLGSSAPQDLLTQGQVLLLNDTTGITIYLNAANTTTYALNFFWIEY